MNIRLSKSNFKEDMARRILCLKNASDQQWRQVNEKFHQLYQMTGDR